MSESKNLSFKQLEEMLEELEKQNELYRPGNYWKYFEKGIVQQIKNNDLTNFRNWEGGPPSNIQTFGGGEQEWNRSFGKNFHPFDKKFDIIDNFFLFKFYNRVINKLSKKFNFFSYFALRGIEAKYHYLEKIKHSQQLISSFVKIYDEDLKNIGDSEIGNPHGNNIDGKFYTSRFFFDLLLFAIIKKKINTNKLRIVAELGSGIGILARIFLKSNKNIKYILCDLPPALFVAENYFKKLNYKTAGYYETKDLASLNDIDLSKYDVICIPNWKAEILKDFKLDLFINVGGLQEMEENQVNNYLNIFSKNTDYIFLHECILGKEKAKSEGEHGVIKPVNSEYYFNYLLNKGFKKLDMIEIENKFAALFKKHDIY